mmetsp:Transcript_32734/g.49332  ORF Transcript_32734/g.49332 Transcript_32734/m.49332 type:complete len:347 (-) Transcript_32734:1601-2641(-)
MLLLLVIAPFILLLVCYLSLALYTLFLSEWTRQRNKYHDARSAIYVGRVSHSRKLPVSHSFSYPIFMALIDLEDNFQKMLSPLSSVMSLREEDHYKNGEGGHGTGLTMAEKTMKLVAEKTEQKFKPTTETHRVILLTHLCYFGYCFNPVSFYYILNKEKNNELDAVVAEVSNTPWLEMSCYVLHKDSIDKVQVQAGRKRKVENIDGINYIFPKSFHVSPFMEMDHIYDWTFWQISGSIDSDNSRNPLCITNSMKKADDLYFNAYLELYRRDCHPYTWALQLISYPVFCFLIQLWIHYEAFFLFVKGVAYVPHPGGSETTASRAIGNLMIPFFALKDWLDAKFTKTQ